MKEEQELNKCAEVKAMNMLNNMAIWKYRKSDIDWKDRMFELAEQTFNAISQKIDWKNIRNYDRETLYSLGFQFAGRDETEELWGIPLWVAPYIPVGFKVSYYFGEYHEWKGFESEDLTTRDGVIGSAILIPRQDIQYNYDI